MHQESAAPVADQDQRRFANLSSLFLAIPHMQPYRIEGSVEHGKTWANGHRVIRSWFGTQVVERQGRASPPHPRHATPGFFLQLHDLAKNI